MAIERTREEFLSLKIFAYTRRDGFLVALALLNFGLLCASTVQFGQHSAAVQLGLGALLCFLVCTNYQCIAHGFIHNAFFCSTALNRAFTLFNTLILGVPQTLYREQHLHHHRYGNDAVDPRTGTTRDQTSTWRRGRSPDREENIFAYAFLGPLRQDVRVYLRAARRKGEGAWVLAEAVAWLAFVAVLTVWNARGVVFFFLPVWYLGHCAALWENYLEHHGAIPGSRRTDSVSCYGRLYNWIWFNNGFHQEHHFRPGVHWSRLPSVREQLPPETQRRVCRGAHWFNFFPPPRSVYVPLAAPSAPVRQYTPEPAPAK